MTLQSVEPVRIAIPPQDQWVHPEAPVRCQAPGCPHRGSEWHHIIRRTATGGPVDWITIDGLVVFNKLRVCLWCHHRITDHMVWIIYDEGWVWWVRSKKATTSLGVWLQHPKSGDWFVKIGAVR